jgi:hypothetical protein
VDVGDGDTIRVGSTVFTVRVESDPRLDTGPLKQLLAVPPAARTYRVGDYELGALLGKGGMGSVKGAPPQRRMVVALKLTRPEMVVEPLALTCSCASGGDGRLRHPSVWRCWTTASRGRVLRAGVLRGRQLSALLLQRDDPLPTDVALRIARQVLDGLCERTGWASMPAT